MPGNRPCIRLRASGGRIEKASVASYGMYGTLVNGLRGLDYGLALKAAEKIDGRISHSHSMLFALCAEEAFSVRVPERAVYIRMLFAELERIHNHLFNMAETVREAGDLRLFLSMMRCQRLLLSCLEKITGGTIIYSVNVIGGVGLDISSGQKNEIARTADIIASRAENFRKYFYGEGFISGACRGVGVLEPASALRLSASGFIGRASGLGTDLRKKEPVLAYDRIKFEAAVCDGGDVLSRLKVCLAEVKESCFAVKQILAALPSGAVSVKYNIPSASAEVLNRCESPLGVEEYRLSCRGRSNSCRITPSVFSSLGCVAAMLEKESEEDIGLILSSVGMSRRLGLVDIEIYES